MARKGERAIVVTTAHADTMIVGVECDQWQNDPVERTRRDVDTVRGFPDSESIANNSGVRKELQKKHFAIARNSRCINALAEVPGGADERIEIDFVARGQVNGY